MYVCLGVLFSTLTPVELIEDAPSVQRDAVFSCMKSQSSHKSRLVAAEDALKVRMEDTLDERAEEERSY